MRVNIQYGVEFEEIPDFLDQLINKCLGDAKTAIFKIEYLKSLIDEEDKIQLAKQIDAARQTLTKVDATLGDLANLAVGYVDAKEQLRNNQLSTTTEPDSSSWNEDPDLSGPDVPENTTTTKVNGEFKHDMELSV